MSHEITENDQVVLHKQPAWHGLGDVIDDALTPTQAAAIALNWNVESAPVHWTPHPFDTVAHASRIADLVRTRSFEDALSACHELMDLAGKVRTSETKKVIYREDTMDEFGVLGTDWTAIQNDELALFCEQLVDEFGGQIKCETVGSIQGGRRVWFLLKGQEFEPVPGDTMFDYLLVSNGHDGTASLRCTPTSIRVVCSNTLHAVIPRDESKSRGGQIAAYCTSHTKNIAGRVAEARNAIAEFYARQDEMRRGIEQLANVQVTTDQMQQFFFDAYKLAFEAVPMNPQDSKQERAKAKAMKICGQYTARFEKESAIAGTTMWNAFNAFSGTIQHDIQPRIKDVDVRRERKLRSCLFGTDADRTAKAYTLALSS